MFIRKFLSPYTSYAGGGWTPVYNDAETQALIDSGYIPIATPQDLNAIKTAYSGAVTREFAVDTKWATGEINTTGVDGNYILVANIDMYDITRTGEYSFSGAGWDTITAFTGVLDGNGYIIHGLYIDRETTTVGLFSSSTGATIKNLSLLDVELYGQRYVAAIIANATTTIIQDCIASGLVYVKYPSYPYAGGLIGQESGSGGTIIERCISSIVVSGSTRVGGIAGRLVSATDKIIDSYSLGITDGNGIIYVNSGSVEDSYYDTETSSRSDTGNGVPKSTALMLSGTPSVDIFTDWGSEWQFKSGKYPALKIFGELAANKPPVENLSSSSSDNNITAEWDVPTEMPEGYNLYEQVDGGIWTKVNSALLTTNNHTYAGTFPADWEAIDYVVGDKVTYDGVVYACILNTTTQQSPDNATYWELYTYEIWLYVKAVYNVRDILQETTNSVKKKL